MAHITVVRERVNRWLDRLNADSVPGDVFRRGVRVQVYKPGSCDHGVFGVVQAYDPESRFFSVVLDSAPTLRRLYLRSELV